MSVSRLSPSSPKSGQPVGAYEVGDIDSEEPGTGARVVGGKPDYSLLPLSTLEPVVRVWESGQKKYKAWNWAKGMAWSVPLACMMRHIAAWQAGETIDEETGQSHMAHVICNAMMLLHYEQCHEFLDDRPTHFRYGYTPGEDDA